MKRALLSATAATAALAFAMPLAAPAHHEPGHEGGGDALTITALPNPVLWADVTTISGKLKGPDHDGRTIELQQKTHPFDGPFQIVNTTATDAGGEYSFTIAPARNTIYRAAVKDSADQTSPDHLVRVKMRINRRVTDRTPRRGKAVTFYGAVAPAHDGGAVHIQRRGADGVYRTVAITSLTDAGERYPTNSFYERRLRIRRDGTYRVAVIEDADHAGNHTRRVRIDVHR